MTKLKIIQGKRREREHKFLAAMFAPGGMECASARSCRGFRAIPRIDAKKRNLLDPPGCAIRAK